MQDERSIVNGSPRSVPWTGMEILLGAFLAWMFWPSAVKSLLDALGFAGWYYGPDAADVETRLWLLWILPLALPLQVLIFPLIFGALSGTRLEQLGLTARHLGRNVLAGVVGVLFLAPVVFGVNWLVRSVYEWLGEPGIEKHQLEKLSELHLFPSEWVMLVLTAMVAAPVLEELTFRGVLQPWLAVRRWGGHLAMLGSFGLTIVYRGRALLAAWPAGVAELASAATPALFVLGLVPVYLLVCWRSRTPRGPAIFGTSLLFACVHTSVWPTPVPLFVLALGLGILADRTHSLVGPIVLHGLFNGISCMVLLLSGGR